MHLYENTQMYMLVCAQTFSRKMCKRSVPFVASGGQIGICQKRSNFFIMFCFNQLRYYFFLLEGIWVLLVLFHLGRQILTITKPNGGTIQTLHPPRVSHNFWFTSRLSTNEEQSHRAGCLTANNMPGDVASASLSFATSTYRHCPSLLSLGSGDRDAISSEPPNLHTVVHAYNLALRGQRQEDLQFETSLGYILRSCSRRKGSRAW